MTSESRDPRPGGYNDVIGSLQRRIDTLERMLRSQGNINVQEVSGTGTLTLTTTDTDIPGLTATVALAGRYLVTVAYDAQGTTAGWNTVVGTVLGNGTALFNTFFMGGDATFVRIKASTVNVYTAAKGDIIKAQARKQINAGVAEVTGTNSRLSIVRIGP